MKKIKLITQTTLAVSAGLLFTACTSSRYEEPAYSSSASYESDYDSSAQYESSDTEYSSAADQSRSSIDEASGAQNVENEIVIPLHEERVNVGKRTVDAGQVTIRKIVTTETVNQPIQLRKETLIIDRGDGQQSSSFSSSQQSSGTSAEWQPGQTSASAQVSSPRAQEQESEYQRNAATANEPSGAFRSESQSSYSGQDRSSDSISADDASGTVFEEQTYTIRLKEERPVVEKTIIQTGKVTAHKDSRMQRQNISQQVRREDVQLDRSNAQNVEIRGNFRSAGQPLTEPSGSERKQDKDAEDLNQQNNEAQPQSDEPDQQESSDTP